jgi:ankyrin repeat protein
MSPGNIPKPQAPGIFHFEDSTESDDIEKFLGSRRLAKGTAAVFMSHFAQAASRGDSAEVARLIDSKTDVNETTLRGTALHEACRRGHLEVAQILCDAGARVDLCDITGDTALHCSVSHGHVAIAALLTSRRADVRAREVAGATPLQCATTSVFIRSDDTRRALIELLLAAGADPDARDLVGVSPAHSGHVQVHRCYIIAILANDSL